MKRDQGWVVCGIGFENASTEKYAGMRMKKAGSVDRQSRGGQWSKGKEANFGMIGREKR